MRTYAGLTFEHGSPASGLSSIDFSISAFSDPVTTNTAR
jgi:hypothetical protein